VHHNAAPRHGRRAVTGSAVGTGLGRIRLGRPRLGRVAWRPVLRVTGELLVTAGVIVAMFLAYMFWGTAMRESQAQRQFASELGSQWAATSLSALGSPSHLVTGRPFAFIRIPAFGRNWRFAIVQGTGLAQLALGPGHVPGTQLPGQRGNFAVAGHRVTAGNPFWSVPRLRRGNLVFIQTINGTYEYKILGKPTWVPPGDTAMLAAVPGHLGRWPHRRLITLITCDPAWSGTSRVVATGELIHKWLRLPAVEGS
jgi:sortase A